MRITKLTCLITMKQPRKIGSDFLRQTPSAPNPHSLGHIVEQTGVTVFFGNKRATHENVAASFPEYGLVILNQTHSDKVVESISSAQSVDGDAHFSRTTKLALCIRTADCVPVMIHDAESGLIAAVHAGWRGIENEIIRKVCVLLKQQGATLSSARAWIGPHIHSASFEVGKDVAVKLESRFQSVQSHSSAKSALVPHEDPLKSRVNLLVIARAQLVAHGIEEDRMTVLSVDTVTSNDHASFRRDKEQAGRQLSFIALK
jgi:YfiH family protein